MRYPPICTSDGVWKLLILPSTCTKFSMAWRLSSLSERDLMQLNRVTRYQLPRSQAALPVKLRICCICDDAFHKMGCIMYCMNTVCLRSFSIIARRRIPSARRILVRLQRLHLSIRQLKAINIGILLDPRRRRGFWKWHKPLNRP